MNKYLKLSPNKGYTIRFAHPNRLKPTSYSPIPLDKNRLKYLCETRGRENDY